MNVKYFMSCYRGYTGQSVGRIFHFIYYYGGLNMAETCSVGSSRVIYYGDVVASNYTFTEVEVTGLNGWKFKSKDVPVFEFTEKYAWMNEQQNSKQHLAILESVLYEATAIVEDIKSQKSKHQLTIDLQHMFHIPGSSKTIEASIELARLDEQLLLAQKIMDEAREHEFDYIRC